jgi:STE24 endopeptidase
MNGLCAALAALVLLAASSARAQAPSSPSEPRQPQPAASEAPAPNPRAKAYSHGGYALYFVAEAWRFAVLLIVLATGLSARLRDSAERISKRRGIAVFLYFALFAVVTALLALPLDMYGGYFRERRYGFAHQTPLAWLGEQGKALALTIVFGGLVLMLVYAVIRRFPRRWWIGAAGVAIAFAIVAMAIAPVFIAPLFNRFTPLPDSPLKHEILELAHSQGIPAKNVYEVDASRQSGHTNAYVAGLLGTQRIVLYDTILKTDTPREILAVLGHEMGHYVLDHVWKGIAFFSALILLGAWLVQRLFRRLSARFGGRWGIRGVSDPAGLPLILLILSIYGFVLTPATNAFSRHLEHQADAFSLRVDGDPDAMITALRKFNTHDLSEYDPPPFIELWLYTHPSLEHRIEFCQRWKTEHGGRS